MEKKNTSQGQGVAGEGVQEGLELVLVPLHVGVVGFQLLRVMGL